MKKPPKEFFLWGLKGGAHLSTAFLSVADGDSQREGTSLHKTYRSQ